MPIPSEKNIAQYLTYLEVEKRYSQHTIVSYKNDLESFATYILKYYEFPDICEAKSIQIRSWLASLKAEDYSAKTLNRKISSLKSFYKYAERQDLITSTPMGPIISPRISKKLPQFIDEKDIFILLNELPFAENFQGRTNKLILQLLYNTGLRQAELIGLLQNNVDVSTGTIRVLGKGNKERIIPVSADLILSIEEYRSLKSQENIPGKNPQLLVLPTGKKLYPRYVYNVCTKYIAMVSTINKKSPHILRHSFATHLANNGADINAVKELLGHSSLAATQVYLHNNIKQLKDVFKLAHPKA